MIRPTLQAIGLWSPVAEDLVLGTAIVESTSGRLQYLRQLGGGPAVSIYQIEPVTARDLVGRWLGHPKRGDLKAKIDALRTPGRTLPEDLVMRLDLATAVCRLRYYSRPQALPPHTLLGLAHYWKDHYNTAAGAGRIVDFVNKVRPWWTMDG